jgi:hypothetical protein
MWSIASLRTFRMWRGIGQRALGSGHVTIADGSIANPAPESFFVRCWFSIKRPACWGFLAMGNHKKFETPPGFQLLPEESKLSESWRAPCFLIDVESICYRESLPRFRIGLPCVRRNRGILAHREASSRGAHFQELSYDRRFRAGGIKY